MVSQGVEGGVTLQRVAVSHAHCAPAAAPAYYVYNNGVAGQAGGFVIVSGDDRTMPILGYSDAGSFDPAELPPSMQWWLDYLAAEVRAAGNDETASQAPRRALGTSVAPMLTTNWGQNHPYNLLLPNTNDGNRATTGCLATSMAQVMYYHRWPVSSTAIPEYTTETQAINRPALPATKFEWESMEDYYTYWSTGAPANAVAKLMLYCGQAIEMDFQDGTSSAYFYKMASALQNYFGYAPSCHYVQRKGFTRTAWEQLLYAELKAGRPVMYGGSTAADNGHSFVCDGYDAASGLFHINWGWNGYGNGYFALSALTTELDGTGDSSEIEGYIDWQNMVVGARPGNQTATASTAMTFSDLEVPTTTYTRSNSGNDFEVTIKGRFSNYTGVMRSLNTGWALYLGSFRVAVVSEGYVYTDLKHGWGGNAEYTISFGGGNSSGTYRLVPISKVSPDGAWEVCEGGDVNYVQAVINGNSLTLTPYGKNGNPKYTVSDVTYEGSQHQGKTMKVMVHLTNSGTSLNDRLYLLVDGMKTTMELLDINPGSSGTVTFFYRPETAGTKTLKFALNDDGTNPIATRSLTIAPMPAANLNMQHELAYAQRTADGLLLHGNTAQVSTTVTNAGAAYDEEVMAYLCRAYTQLDDGSYRGTIMQTVTQPLKLAAGASQKLTFTFDGLNTGDKYFVNYYYFSSGKTVNAGGTSIFTVAGGEAIVPGDVDGNGVVDVDDLNIVINVMLRKNQDPSLKTQADLNGDGSVDVDDMNRIINVMLRKE